MHANVMHGVCVICIRAHVYVYACARARVSAYRINDRIWQKRGPSRTELVVKGSFEIFLF